ncbi:MAG TPA: hypothetical protein VI039_13175 [Solirubrobacterales bacterium]
MSDQIAHNPRGPGMGAGAPERRRLAAVGGRHAETPQERRARLWQIRQTLDLPPSPDRLPAFYEDTDDSS